MADSNSIAWITGASSGIGEACAYALAEKGFKLCLGARRTNRLGELKSRIEEQFPTAEVFCAPLDVRSTESCETFGNAAISEMGPPDVLVNNAGLVKGVDPIAEGKDDDWALILETNVLGLLKMTRLALQSMLERKKGHIILIGSIAGHQAYPGGSAYCASKFGVKAIANSLKQEVLGQNVRVSSVDPGLVNTEFSTVRLGSKEKADQVYAGMTPLIAEDIADCVSFIATRPAHVNIDQLIVMPTDQATAQKVHRRLETKT